MLIVELKKDDYWLVENTMYRRKEGNHFSDNDPLYIMKRHGKGTATYWGWCGYEDGTDRMVKWI